MNIKSIQILGIFVFVFLMDTNESQKEERECKALYVCAHIRLSVLSKCEKTFGNLLLQKKEREKRKTGKEVISILSV